MFRFEISEYDARLLHFGDRIHDAAKTDVVAGRSERLKSLVRGAGLEPAVAVSPAANDAARIIIRFHAERISVCPLIVDPFPHIAGHVVASIRAGTLGEAPARQLAVGTDQR